MKTIVKQIKTSTSTINYEWLKSFINQFDIDELQYESYINEPSVKGDYGRNVLILEPFECVLINWPPGVESAVHHHKGLFGYVWVLEGELDNILYKEENGKLIEYSMDRYVRNGLMPEPDGVIHKIANKSRTKRAITLHFYYPALVTLENLRIFNVEKGHSGILSKEAPTANWSDNPTFFKNISKNQFEYVTFQDLNKNKSHTISYVVPKPNRSRINEMNSEYFCDQAKKYDFSDINQPNIKLYIETIDKIIGEDLQYLSITKHIDITTGSGKRAMNIREISGKNYEIEGVNYYYKNWENVDTYKGELFDSASFLNVFGHISHEEGRIRTLKKINSYLKTGAPLYLDLFNLHNIHEWGPQALLAYEKNNLIDFNYQKGDVFYKKRGGDSIAFMHYFELDEIRGLLKKSGFDIGFIRMVGYSKKSGEIVQNNNEGNFFIKALKM